MDRPIPSKRRLRSRLAAVLNDRRGATAVEYGLIVSLIVIVMVTALVEVGKQTSTIWNNVSTKVTNAH